MRVLDIDLDYFLDCPVNNRDHSSNERVKDIDCINSVWSESRVRSFLEDNLGLSKDRKINGRVFVGHDEAIYFWEELIDNGKLKTPFSVVHVDAHPDLGYGGIGKCFVLEELLLRDLKYRKPKLCKDCEFEGRFYSIDIGDYLLYGIAFRWFSEIIYIANPNNDYGAIPDEIISRPINVPLRKPTQYYLQLKLRNTVELSENEIPNEPQIPLYVFPSHENIKPFESFDYISVAQSPNYTPKEADYIIEVIKDYIEII